MNANEETTRDDVGCSKRVLVVEDNPALAGVIQFNLERSGCKVTVAKNGAEALSSLKLERYDLVVTDQEMPKMTGLELCQQIRSSEESSELPLIMITAKQMELDRSDVRGRLRIDAILPKPFSPAELVTRVAECLSAAAPQ